MISALLGLSLLQSDVPRAPREFRAVWVATVDNIDWPSKRTLTTNEQKLELIRIMDKAAELSLNAVIFQIRPSCDSLYDSKLEPWSEYLTNAQGKAPNPYYDPLQFAVEQAHKRGLELHTWFNPYRAKHPAQKGPLAPNHIENTHPELSKTYGNYLWLDPGEPEVQKRSLDVMLDVVKRYDIDGVHIDDYFYPYPIRENGQAVRFPDQGSYAKYGGGLSLSDWRRKNVDTFIERLYKGIKETKKWVKFGISPFGIYRPGIPDTIKAGIDQYEELSADALKWFKNGWCDYFTPQLYWPIKQTPQSYPVLLKWWAGQNEKQRHLWPGNFTGRVRTDDGNWPPQEIVDQIEITRDVKGAGGNVHFSMRVFMLNAQNLNAVLKAGPYRDKALVPASKWLDGEPPSPPKSLRLVNGATLSWTGSSAADAEFSAVYGKRGGVWKLVQIVPAKQTSLPVLAGNEVWAVSAIDRAGNESQPVFLR